MSTLLDSIMRQHFFWHIAICVVDTCKALCVMEMIFVGLSSAPVHGHGHGYGPVYGHVRGHGHPGVVGYLSPKSMQIFQKLTCVCFSLVLSNQCDWYDRCDQHPPRHRTRMHRQLLWRPFSPVIELTLVLSRAFLIDGSDFDYDGENIWGGDDNSDNANYIRIMTMMMTVMIYI